MLGLKEPACQCRGGKGRRLDPGGGDPWGRERRPTPVFLERPVSVRLRESDVTGHAHRSVVSHSLEPLKLGLIFLLGFNTWFTPT